MTTALHELHEENGDVTTAYFHTLIVLIYHAIMGADAKLFWDAFAVESRAH